MRSSFTYPSLPSIAFAATALLLILHERAKTKNGKAKQDDTTNMTREEVLELRQKHFMKAVSISYANSGGLMIMGVSASDDWTLF